MPLRREIIRTKANEAVIVQLDRDLHGKEVRGQYGAQCALTVNGGRATLYLDQQHGEVLRRSGARPGDTVELLKEFDGQMPSYNVRVVSDAAEPAQPQASRLVAPQAGYSNGNGHTRTARPSAPAPETTRAVSHIASCLCAAIDAAIAAQEYARMNNFSVTFLGSDIRAMANSVYINDQQNGGAR
jgi:hypothetical protein